MIAAAPDRIRNLYVKRGAERRFESLMQAVRNSGGEVLVLVSDELARLAGSVARHQGIIAALHEYSYASLGQVLARRPDPLVVLDGITDPRNLGAILRTCECAGANTVVLAKDRTVGLTPGAIKSSAGAWAHLMIARCGNMANTIETLKHEGYWIVAVDPRGDTSLYDLDVTRQLALVLGAEGHGIREIVRRATDFQVRIPLYGRIASLNVSVATALALFEIVRRRAHSGSR